jgi:hypothetical protein
MTDSPRASPRPPSSSAGSSSSSSGSASHAPARHVELAPQSVPSAALLSAEHAAGRPRPEPAPPEHAPATLHAPDAGHGARSAHD